MKKAVALLVGVVLVAVGVIVASIASRSTAATPPKIRLHAFLNGPQEVPATASTSYGTAHIVLQGTKVCFEIAYSPLTTPETGAHIHEGVRGVEGTILVTLPAANPKIGCATVSTGTATKIRSRQTYINIHGTGDPLQDGEIRGQIVPN